MTTPAFSLETLLKIALLGTGRDSALPALDGPLRPFGESKGSPETALLGAAVALTLGARAGRLPTRGETPPIPLCPPETRPHFSPRAAALLDGCLSGQRELVPQALLWAARSGQIAPPALLPRLLELGRGSKELRRDLAPILGERGRWLAQLNPDWRAVAAPLDADLEASWHDGELAARREALRLKRETEPAAAREWIEAAFKTEGAKERAQWLETLEIGLSDADEPFLEVALGDKSKEVRAVAVPLLERLPDSRLVARAKAELEPLLSWKAKPASLLGALLHRAPNGGEIEVELPEKWRPEWARDGLEEKVSPYNRVRNVGEKAAWLARFLERVPPSHWEAKWNASPAQIVAGAPQEWRELLIGAWWQAAKIGGDRAWLEAIATQTDLKTPRGTLNFSGLSAANADALAVALFRRGDHDFSTDGPLSALLRAHPGPWSVEVARQFLQQVQKSLPLWHQSNSSPLNHQFHRLRFDLPAAADKFPIEMAGEAAQGWPQADAINEQWQPIIAQFLSRLQFRADLQAAFAPSLSNSIPTPNSNATP